MRSFDRWSPLSFLASLLLSLWLGVGCSGGSGPVSAAATDSVSGAELIEAPRVTPLRQRGWVEVEAAVLAADDESPAAARRRAIRRARQAAIEYVAGVSVRSSVVTLDQVDEAGARDLLQALTATQSDALIVDEALRDARVELSQDGGYRVRVTLAARVLEHDRGARASFETEVRLNRSRFRTGEAVELGVRVSEPARVYVLSVSAEGASVLLPNRHMPDTRIEADRWLEFPGEALARRGVAMHAALPEGRMESREALIVVALRGRRRLDDLFPASGATFRQAEGGQAMALASEFLSPLLSMPAEDWTFDQLVYTIEGR